ncbi:aspartyl-phosphate phosphatase Spo0E family protein [Paenibacillus polysaccharolyticus]|uniref:aspartyl-phosphate phosphatase Spo0E family protein n=1 Tax=Paenibacillus TaxID=44249 RepID=UPI0008BADCDA|nr:MULTISPECIES: aspartyl-phosphate phosphatase Spo0E family protein [Paenibacillus]MCP1137526.1 aspartyl-phosphate phosphatase Spo0E family protein [Paenibacillus polysaccharolyticus]SEP33500.1 Spo0E like sporulation regulatory protein [Paenibacillus sp. OK076]
MEKSMLIKLRIERARNRLHALTAKHENFQHPAVIKQSMVLDDLINQYNRIGDQQIKKPIG